MASAGDVVVKEGVVKWFDTKKGFGFISQTDGGTDVFVHYSVIKQEGFKDLEEGDRVRYEMIPSDKGPKALAVSRIT
jgi:CspA family cold shock protein